MLRIPDVPTAASPRVTTLPDRCLPGGMYTAFISNVSFDPRHLFVRITRTWEVTIALERLPRLAAATEEQRRAWELRDRGTCICWPALGYQLSLADMLAARREALSVPRTGGDTGAAN